MIFTAETKTSNLLVDPVHSVTSNAASSCIAMDLQRLAEERRYKMTANQINYARVREDRRHNLISEKHEHEDVRTRRMTAGANVSQAETARLRQSEDARHNRMSERFNTEKLNIESAETRRHNAATEDVQRFSALAESIYKQSKAQFESRQAAVSEREASVRERQAAVSEREVSSRERMESVERSKAHSQYLAALASQEQAKVAGVRAETEKSQLAESIRHAQAVEHETSRHNMYDESIRVAQNNETRRHQLETEAIETIKAGAAETRAGAAKIQAYAHAIGTTFEVAKQIAAAYAMGG